jgi:hypothetical protein
MVDERATFATDSANLTVDAHFSLMQTLAPIQVHRGSVKLHDKGLALTTRGRPTQIPLGDIGCQTAEGFLARHFTQFVGERLEPFKGSELGITAHGELLWLMAMRASVMNQ